MYETQNIRKGKYELIIRNQGEKRGKFRNIEKKMMVINYGKKLWIILRYRKKNFDNKTNEIEQKKWKINSRKANKIMKINKREQ